MQRLPNGSLTGALAAGDRNGFGWDVNTFLLAELVDATNLNTKATGNWKKGKAPEFPLYPRPKFSSGSADSDAPSEKKSKFSVAALHRKFLGGN